MKTKSGKTAKQHLFDIILIVSILTGVGLGMTFGIAGVQAQSRSKDKEYTQITKPIYESIDRLKSGEMN